MSKYSGDSPEQLRGPVLVAGDDDDAAADLGADDGDAGDFPLNGLGVLHGQGAGPTPPAVQSAAGEAAGKDQDDVLAHAGDLRFDLGFGAVADADGGDDGGNADDHAQRG